MNSKKISSRISVAGQISHADISTAAVEGIKTIICNRPNAETADQPDASLLARAAAAAGIEFLHIPVVSGAITEENVVDFAAAYENAEGPILAYCRSGKRSTILWALSEAQTQEVDSILAAAGNAGHDLSAMRPALEARAAQARRPGVAATKPHRYDVVIVGGGAGGIGTASSLLNRDSSLDILIIEPQDTHYYQPGWTMVGGGIFQQDVTHRSMESVMPSGVTWRKAAVANFEPQDDCVFLDDGTRINYRSLVVAPGLKLDWDAIDGLVDALGENGVTSNYRFDLAPYTWSLVQGLEAGRAIFTQPPMPIKCAGAPQKAMYLSCDHWYRMKRLGNIEVDFRNAGPGLFGVADYVPALMKYIEKYDVNLCFSENLVAVDGPARKAWFDRTDADGQVSRVEVSFNMLHVCPPQTAPDFVRQSPLASESGWVDVSPDTLQHVRYENVFSVGDANSAPNAKTAAAVRKQAPIVAENLISQLTGKELRCTYDGYGSCPLTVEKGKIVLAEFGYGGKHLPTFPQWILNSFEPTRLAWLMKVMLLPAIYWHFLLKGREWLASPME